MNIDAHTKVGYVFFLRKKKHKTYLIPGKGGLGFFQKKQANRLFFRKARLSFSFQTFEWRYKLVEMHDGMRDLQVSIAALETWCGHSGLTLNGDKCVFMLFERPSSLHSPLFANNVSQRPSLCLCIYIPPSSQVPYGR